MQKIICLAITLCAFSLNAQNQQLQKMIEPNENHRALEVFVGFWEATAKVYDGKGNILYKEDGFCENRWVLGKRFVILEHMFLSFHTAALVGYDNFLQHYTAAHIDSQSTGIHHFIGEKAVNRFFLKGESIGFDGELVDTVYLLTAKNANNYSMEIYYEIEDQPAKLMEIEFKKVETAARGQKKISQAVVRSFSDGGMNTINKNLRPLRPLVGKWKVESMIFDDSGNILRIDEGQAANRWIMMQKFVLMTAEMGNYQSMTIMGYDNQKKSYVSAHADNIGTSIYHGEGDLEKNKIFKLFGTAMDYATGEKTELTQVTEIKNNDLHTLEMYRERDKVGLDVSTLKVTAKRIK